MKKMLAALSLIIVGISFLLLIMQSFQHLQQTSLHTIHVKGVIDRYENSLAVILVEELEEEFIVPKEELPRGSTEEMWLDISVSKKEFEIISIQEETTEHENKRVGELLKRLQE
ncbi:DUF3006 family protein [Oceanobacillus salinisoli]|uniref:DUF3006 family protein n=1 Tax=Oceanobacillus salinisoli TaxID=2678611 RepID=UPI0018CC062D|nr:DUF3006 family protein [Oceanobacillus salinisoli]